jgi:DNA mismatch repair protein MutS2
MNRHALQVLQFPEALDLVAGFASSSLGAAAVRRLEPSDALIQVEEELRRVHEMVGFLLRAADWFVPAIPEVQAALERLAVEGSVLDAPTLRDMAVLLLSSREARRTLLQHAEDYPLLAAIAERLAKLPEVEDRLRAAIDDAGTVRDDASRELGRLRREMRGARARIIKKLEEYIATLPSRFQVQDASVSVREGRYVIPVRREGRGEVGGLVHDESATGATLFVEPPIAIDLMNRLRELELAETREVQRILRELTHALRPHQPALDAALDALVAIDALFARARYALEYDGRRPEIGPRAGTEYAVVRAFHPLLLAGGSPVVPFDLAFTDDERTMLVSGPNTGGKTVLLKAIGLISALAQAGIIPPVAKGTRLPLFRDIFADIGDEQSIEASLSTFSAHLKNLREILEEADGHALALIDEIGSGTDPAEGGALAQAILVELTRRGTMTVATTHLGQLKLLAAEEPGVVNASLQFDARELRPTYRLLKGIPGRSYGLAIARRLGFPHDLLERAESFLPQAERDVGQLLLELEDKEARLAAALREAERARREAVELREAVAERADALSTREREAERRTRQQARDILMSAREEVEATIRELREAVEQAGDAAAREEAFRQARRRVEQRAERQRERTPTERPAAAPAAQALEVGAHVRVSATGATGRIVELRDGRAVVETGGVRLQVPVGGLVPEPEPVQAQAVARPRRGGYSVADFDASAEIDLRGMRAEEVETALLPALDAAIQAGLPSFRIIHGKGTGALRDVVQQILKADPRIDRYRPGGLGEGGTGVTVVELG